MLSLAYIESVTQPIFPCGPLTPGTTCPHTDDNLPAHPWACGICSRSWADPIIRSIIALEKTKTRPAGSDCRNKKPVSGRVAYTTTKDK